MWLGVNFGFMSINIYQPIESILSVKILFFCDIANDLFD